MLRKAKYRKLSLNFKHLSLKHESKEVVGAVLTFYMKNNSRFKAFNGGVLPRKTLFCVVLCSESFS